MIFLVASAALHVVLSLFPSAKFTLMGNAIWRNIVTPSQWPKISHFIECERKSLKQSILYSANLKDDIWCKKEKIVSLSRVLNEYDIGINLQYESLRFAWALFRARVKVRVGSYQSKWAKFFYTHFSQIVKPHNNHMRDVYLSVLSSINQGFVSQQKRYWDFHSLPKLKLMDPERFKKRFGDSFVVINPTASIREKAWDAKNFKILVDILTKYNMNPIVVGMITETEWLKEIATDHAIIYQTSCLFDICDLIAAAKILITNTVLCSFIAASVGTKTLTLMGCANPIVWGPLGKPNEVIKTVLNPDHQ